MRDVIGSASVAACSMVQICKKRHRQRQYKILSDGDSEQPIESLKWNERIKEGLEMPLKGAPRSSIARTELGIVDRSVWRRRTTLEAKNLDQQKRVR
jgi:hypothetical protein